MPASVSIVIPIYNVASYIEKCLDSVGKQTYKNLEVILVDDCGTDESMTLVERYLRRHHFPSTQIVKHTHNRGLSAARNTGLEAATGDYVYFLDSDDALTEDCISILATPVEEQLYDFVIGNYEVDGDDKEYPALTLSSGALRSNKEILHAYAEAKWYMMAWNKLCNRKFLLDNKLFFEEGLLHEDVIWSFELACKAQLMYVITETTYKYTVRAASIMTGTSLAKDARLYVKAFDVISRFVQGENLLYERDAYYIIEGRKSTLLFSLLQKEEKELFNECYASIYRMPHVGPVAIFMHKVIGWKCLLRDFHYLLPMACGREYKYLFYKLFYKWRGKPIEGSLL